MTDATGWMPIETAPKVDGELILVAGFWSNGSAWRAIGFASAYGDVWGDWNDPDGPTHWMPLPPPPEPTP